MRGQSEEKDLTDLLNLVFNSSKSSFAADSREKGIPFYEEMISFWDNSDRI